MLLNALKTSFSYFDKLEAFCLSKIGRQPSKYPAFYSVFLLFPFFGSFGSTWVSLCHLKPIFPAVAVHTKAGKIGTLLLNALKTSFSYFDKIGSFCLSSLCRLKPIFPAVAAHTKAGKIGTLLLNALKTSFSYFDKRGSFCLSSLCRLEPIFPAVAAHTKAEK